MFPDLQQAKPRVVFKAATNVRVLPLVFQMQQAPLTVTGRGGSDGESLIPCCNPPAVFSLPPAFCSLLVASKSSKPPVKQLVRQFYTLRLSSLTISRIVLVSVGGSSMPSNKLTFLMKQDKFHEMTFCTLRCNKVCMYSLDTPHFFNTSSVMCLASITPKLPQICNDIVTFALLFIAFTHVNSTKTYGVHRIDAGRRKRHVHFDPKLLGNGDQSLVVNSFGIKKSCQYKNGLRV